MIAAAKTAGAKFKAVLPGLTEAGAAQGVGRTSFWVMDQRPGGLTLTMTPRGVGEKRSLSCVLYAPPHAGITLDAAVAHVRAVMGLGEPTSLDQSGAGASWFLGPVPDQKRIGVSVAPADGDAATSIAVITPGTLQSTTEAAPTTAAEAGLKAAVAQLKLTLPRAINENVAVTDVRVEGMTVVYVAEVKSGAATQEMSVLEYDMKQTLCASDARAMFHDGISVAYEYWRPAPQRTLLGTITISACP